MTYIDKKFLTTTRIIIFLPILLLFGFGIAMLSLNFRMDICILTNRLLCINIPIRSATAPGSLTKENTINNNIKGGLD
jgi:hypothetical protein